MTTPSDAARPEPKKNPKYTDRWVDGAGVYHEFKFASYFANVLEGGTHKRYVYDLGDGRWMIGDRKIGEDRHPLERIQIVDEQPENPDIDRLVGSYSDGQNNRIGHWLETHAGLFRIVDMIDYEAGRGWDAVCEVIERNETRLWGQDFAIISTRALEGTWFHSRKCPCRQGHW